MSWYEPTLCHDQKSMSGPDTLRWPHRRILVFQMDLWQHVLHVANWPWHAFLKFLLARKQKRWLFPFLHCFFVSIFYVGFLICGPSKNMGRHTAQQKALGFFIRQARNSALSTQSILGPCYLLCGPMPTAMEKCQKYRLSRPSPDLLSQNLHFNKLPTH